ncbi:MAG TPA: hypothetical protein VM120_23245 [Bryobacteraceae bacterium]|nr:hypothetical protein [Bryobacteraceae bacterium]
MRFILFLLVNGLGAQDRPAPATPAKQFEEQRLQQLLGVKRVYVDRLIGSGADQIRDMLMTSLQSASLFIITENEQKADAILRGSAVDVIYTDTFQSSEGIHVRGSGNQGRGAGRTRQSSSSGLTLGENESTRTSERRHEASAALRLVNKEGDLLWSTTQESLGAKFRSASADVADKVMKQLTLDYESARRRKP